MAFVHFEDSGWVIRRVGKDPGAIGSGEAWPSELNPSGSPCAGAAMLRLHTECGWPSR